MKHHIPERGQIWEIDFEPQVGREQMKRRPALVISPARFNVRGIAILCPITSRQKNNELEVPLATDLTVKGTVMAWQPKSFDWKARKAKYLCVVDQYTLQTTQEILQALIND